MFEESGVLLARDRDEFKKMMSYLPGSFPPAIMGMSEECASQWRNRVHINAKNFVTMCRFAGIPNCTDSRINPMEAPSVDRLSIKILFICILKLLKPTVDSLLAFHRL